MRSFHHIVCALAALLSAACATVRFSPVTGKGAVNLQYTAPNRAADPDFFWMVYLWRGYGEDLLNYNRSIFGVGVGVSLAR